MKHRMFLAVILSVGLVAPSFAADAPVPPVVPAGDTPAPVLPKAEKKKAAAKKATAKKPAAEAKEKTPAGTTKLASPAPAVVTQPNVNVRGQAKYTSEIVTRLKKGDRITVIEEITTKQKPDEPNRWYKIALPSTVSVWVHSSFIDANKTVIPQKLNLRAGPGENYSILGQLEKGTTVNVAETKGDWSKIEPPATAFAFVAAHLVSREPADIAASAPAIAKATPPAPVVPPPPPPTTTSPTPPVIAPPADVTPPKTEPTITPPPPPSTGPLTLTPVPAPEETLVKRVVTREGIVKGSVSIQAPSYFVLRSLDNNKTINYLHSASTNIVVREFRNQRVLISGEEMLDERWPNTPVIEIESIQAVQE
jgi:SH3-like domain-containing protein